MNRQPETYDADIQRFLRSRALQAQAEKLLQMARRNECRVQIMERRSLAVISRLETRLAAQVA